MLTSDKLRLESVVTRGENLQHDLRAKLVAVSNANDQLNEQMALTRKASNPGSPLRAPALGLTTQRL